MRSTWRMCSEGVLKRMYVCQGERKRVTSFSPGWNQQNGPQNPPQWMERCTSSHPQGWKTPDLLYILFKISPLDHLFHFCNQTSNKYYLALFFSFYKNKTDDTLSARGSDQRRNVTWQMLWSPYRNTGSAQAVCTGAGCTRRSLSFVLNWQKETDRKETQLRLRWGWQSREQTA